MICKEKRSKLMADLMAGIKTVKSYAWEIPMMERIEDLRHAEMEKVRRQVINSAFKSTTNPIWEGGKNLFQILTLSSYLIPHFIWFLSYSCFWLNTWTVGVVASANGHITWRDSIPRLYLRVCLSHSHGPKERSRCCENIHNDFAVQYPQIACGFPPAHGLIPDRVLRVAKPREPLPPIEWNRRARSAAEYTDAR